MMGMRYSSKRPSSSAALMRAAHWVSRRRRMSSMSFSAKLCTRLRPCSLAAAQAPSAADRIDATSALSAVIGTTPTLARQRVAPADLGLEQGAHMPEQRVTRRVPAGIVDHLELVDIQMAQRVRT